VAHCIIFKKIDFPPLIVFARQQIEPRINAIAWMLSLNVEEDGWRDGKMRE
jgi:hypothetical protein